MAIQKNSPPKRRAKETARAAPKRAKANVELPSQKSTILADLSDYAIMLYGYPSCGKTTLAAQFEDCFHMMFEPGGKALEIYQKPVRTWPEAIAYADLIAAGGHTFKNVSVDTSEIAYELCFDWVMENKLNGQHPNDLNDRGKSWKMISDEFKKQFFHKLLNADVGTIWLSHVRDNASEAAEKDEVKWQITPNLSGAPLGIITGMMDVIGCYEVIGPNERILTIVPDGVRTAKNRLEQQFRTPNGEPVQSISMGTSPQESHANLLAAFDNKQATVYASGEKGGQQAPTRRKAKRRAPRRRKG